MKLLRSWATPLTAGAFIVLATTGLLMFFHLDRGLNHFAHEWIGWILLLGVACHITANFSGFSKTYFRTPWTVSSSSFHFDTSSEFYSA